MPTFAIETKKIDGPSIFVVKTRGYFDESGGQKFSEIVRGLVQQGGRRFIINLKDTPIINSQGIAALLEILDEIVYDHHGEAAFCGLSKAINDVFRMTGISTTFKVHDTEEAAISLLSQSSQR